MTNGFCQLCNLNVTEEGFKDHATKHLKDQAASYARTNIAPPNTPIQFYASMRVTDVGGTS